MSVEAVTVLHSALQQANIAAAVIQKCADDREREIVSLRDEVAILKTKLKMAEDALVKERAVFKEREEKYRKERVETVEALAQAARTIDGLAERHRRPLVALPSANIPTVRKAIDIDTVDDERVAIGPLPLLAEPTVRHAEEAIRSSTSCKRARTSEASDKRVEQDRTSVTLRLSSRALDSVVFSKWCKPPNRTWVQQPSGEFRTKSRQVILRKEQLAYDFRKLPKTANPPNISSHFAKLENSLFPFP
ncbi:hypothetical protein B0H19DRAFT_1257547 [Mycena capillaripes]|nr:hypothetical protein B0H19DRAFT_1257547 [Mycena capillaripes]